jgi:hypothetical protein
MTGRAFMRFGAPKLRVIEKLPFFDITLAVIQT